LRIETEAIATRVIKERLQRIADSFSPEFLSGLEAYLYRFTIPLDNDTLLEVKVSVHKFYQRNDTEEEEWH
jgi:hypothetical protein